jgi:DNA-binding transcriptional ArsR family regulator
MYNIYHYLSCLIIEQYKYGFFYKNKMPDPSTKRLLWFLFAGSKGGANRIKIIDLIQEQPYNTNQLAGFLKIDYKTVQHHLSVLEKNNLISKMGDKYGILYFISNYLESNMNAYQEVKSKILSNKRDNI